MNFDFSLVNTNFSDIRILDESTNFLSNWVEVYDFNNQYAKIWFRSSQLSSGETTTHRLIYGNKNASSTSDLNSVFDAGVDYLKADPYEASITVNGNYCNEFQSPLDYCLPQ